METGEDATVRREKAFHRTSFRHCRTIDLESTDSHIDDYMRDQGVSVEKPQKRNNPPEYGARRTKRPCLPSREAGPCSVRTLWKPSPIS